MPARLPARRALLRGGAALSLSGLFAALSGCASRGGGAPLLGFEPVAPSTADALRLPPGYTATPLAAWGDPVGLPGHAPAFRHDAGNSAADQEAQLGMHHDGMHYFPIDGSRRGLLVINHEYADDGLLHPDGTARWSAETVRKHQAAVGISVVEVRLGPQGWTVASPSRWARRITANTPVAISGPAAGHPLLRTAFDPSGRRVLGTLANCGSGMTPWGTFLSCEENFIGYFDGPAQPDAHQRRWEMEAGGYGLRWQEFDPRFDASRHPNEPNRFGWVVELDPFDPTATPVKRTALGRAAHESALVVLADDGRAVVYSGEDAAFEYLYKFVSRDPMRPGGARANADLLDHGTLYVARFDADGSGQWLPLVHGQGPLVAAHGLRDPGELLVKTRQASDLLGATRLDRPEWVAAGRDGWLYCALTNNSARGRPGAPGPDAANPRAPNRMGHILRWQEDGGYAGTRLRWSHFLQAGAPGTAGGRARTAGATTITDKTRALVHSDALACPDGLWMDPRGVLWIQTDMSAAAMGRGDFAPLGNNALLAADPHTGDVRRFMVGPPGCEITGLTATPDGRTLFVNIQHPGEVPSYVSDPAAPRKVSNWPDFRADGRPRSATVAIRRGDGGVVGA